MNNSSSRSRFKGDKLRLGRTRESDLDRRREFNVGEAREASFDGVESVKSSSSSDSAQASVHASIDSRGDSGDSTRLHFSSIGESRSGVNADLLEVHLKLEYRKDACNNSNNLVEQHVAR